MNKHLYIKDLLKVNHKQITNFDIFRHCFEHVRPQDVIVDIIQIEQNVRM